MFSGLSLLVSTLRLVAIASALSACVLGQPPAYSGSESMDVFSSMHQNLTEAADRSLAAVLANQTWMDSTGSITNHDKPSSTSAESSSLKVRAAVDRVNQLKRILEPIFRNEGVPVELVAVVLVESGGLPAAISPKGARGVWQFMPATARRYGLVVDAARDDRTDVVKSTRAAARYLRDLHETFGDWSLALAAYNAGEVVVANAVNQMKTKNFDAISGGTLLPVETRNYVPAVMAAMNRLQYSAVGNFDGPPTKGTHVVYAVSGGSE